MSVVLLALVQGRQGCGGRPARTSRHVAREAEVCLLSRVDRVTAAQQRVRHLRRRVLRRLVGGRDDGLAPECAPGTEEPVQDRRTKVPAAAVVWRLEQSDWQAGRWEQL